MGVENRCAKSECHKKNGSLSTIPPRLIGRHVQRIMQVLKQPIRTVGNSLVGGCKLADADAEEVGVDKAQRG